MLQQLVPLMLIAVIGATPMVREFCRIACSGPSSGPSSHAQHGGAATPEHVVAGHASHSAAPPVASSHHEHAALEPAGQSEHLNAESCGPPALGSRRDCCEDADPRAASMPGSKPANDPPASMPQAIVSAARIDAAIRSRLDASARPPVPLALRTPLRV